MRSLRGTLRTEHPQSGSGGRGFDTESPQGKGTGGEGSLRRTRKEREIIRREGFPEYGDALCRTCRAGFPACFFVGQPSPASGDAAAIPCGNILGRNAALCRDSAVGRFEVRADARVLMRADSGFGCRDCAHSESGRGTFRPGRLPFPGCGRSAPKETGALRSGRNRLRMRPVMSEVSGIVLRCRRKSVAPRAAGRRCGIHAVFGP